jgi:methylmalonyl-CoA mutase
MNIATRKEIFLGTNQYPNAAEQMNTQIDKRANVSKKPANKIQTLRQYRGAEAFENIRIEVEQHAKTPKVLMLTFGSPTMRRARSQFASNFFACAAYQIFDHNGFKTVAEGVQYAKEINADIVVMCSEDDAYPEMVQSLSSEQKSEFIWVIAGYPKDQIEMLQLSGIEHFIHIKSNVLAQLSQFNRLILK